MTKEQMAETLLTLLSNAGGNEFGRPEILEDERSVVAVEVSDGTEFFIQVVDA